MLAFLVGPAFFRILRFKGTAQHVLGIGVAATGKTLVNERFEIGGGRLIAWTVSPCFHRRVLPRLGGKGTAFCVL